MPLIWRSDPGAPARQADTTCVLPLLSCQVLDVLILLWTSSTVKLEVINIAPDGHLVFFFFGGGGHGTLRVMACPVLRFRGESG